MPVHSATITKQQRAAFIQGALKVKHDCFAYDKYGRSCRVMTELICMNKKCSFGRTQQDRCESCKKTRKTITCEECKKRGLC